MIGTRAATTSARCRAARARLALAALAGVALVAALQPPLAAQAHTRTFGWKVTGRQGAIYLVGSVHLLTKDFYPLHDALEAAYQD